MGAVQTVLALLVAGVWAIVTLASIVTGNYQALQTVTPVMTIVAGFLFAQRSEFADKSSRKRRARRTPRG